MAQRPEHEEYTNLANRPDPPIRIRCMTCHHGLTQPRLLEDVLKTAYDSMGEGYCQKGDRKQAIAAYQKSLELDPSNQSAIDELKELKTKPKSTKKS
jgi:tetratricopeptide (TPR) repeat protein